MQPYFLWIARHKYTNKSQRNETYCKSISRMDVRQANTVTHNPRQGSHIGNLLHSRQKPSNLKKYSDQFLILSLPVQVCRNCAVPPASTFPREHSHKSDPTKNILKGRLIMSTIPPRSYSVETPFWSSSSGHLSSPGTPVHLHTSLPPYLKRDSARNKNIDIIFLSYI